MPISFLSILRWPYPWRERWIADFQIPHSRLRRRFRKRPTGSFDDGFDLIFQLGYSHSDVLGESVSKLGESLHFALKQLVVLHDDLNKFTCVDVWIARVLHVLNDLYGNMGG